MSRLPIELKQNPFPEQWEQGWLSPKGEYWELHEWSCHEETGYELIKAQGMEEAFHKWEMDGRGGDGAYEYLEEQGWIRLHGYSDSKWIVCDIKPTFAQKQKIREWLRINKLSWEAGVTQW